ERVFLQKQKGCEDWSGQHPALLQDRWRLSATPRAYHLLYTCGVLIKAQGRVVKNRAPAPNSWRWEIYRAGRSNPIGQSPTFFRTTVAANRAGKAALKQLSAKLNAWRLLSARSALNLEILCRCFSFVCDFFVFDNLPFIEAGEAGFLHRRDMDKHVFSAGLRLNKSIAFLRIEPLHGAARHSRSPLLTFYDSLANSG